jgi:hypothetical protein
MVIAHSPASFLEDKPTIITSLEYDPHTVRPIGDHDIFEIILGGQGEIMIGNEKYDFLPGDLCLLAPQYQQVVHFKKTEEPARQKLVLGRLQFFRSSGWMQFLACLENYWMVSLLQQAENGKYVKGDHYNEPEKLFRQMLLIPGEVKNSVFVRYYEEDL